jgi:hypothetical protein
MPPTETTTPTVQPTALPLPITEDFSQQYSDLWRVIGNPIIIERTQNSYGAYSGVLTSGDSGLATLMIGNSAWTDLIVNLASSCWNCPVAEIGKIVIGVRVEDMNNMVALVCTGFYDCTWTIFEDGVEKKTPAYAFMAITENLTITVQGNSFTAIGESQSRGRVTNSMILEPQYQGKFTNGGVLLQVSPEREVDFIQIYPLP